MSAEWTLIAAVVRAPDLAQELEEVRTPFVFAALYFKSATAVVLGGELARADFDWPDARARLLRQPTNHEWVNRFTEWLASFPRVTEEGLAEALAEVREGFVRPRRLGRAAHRWNRAIAREGCEVAA